MVQYIITPWRNKAELLHVREQLYPGVKKPLNDPDRRRAVAQVSVWMQRGNCPHLVESSAILTSAMLNDVPGNSTYCVRAAYSAAFCRFVTGLLDSHQDKKRKLSMYSIAKSIGLPATYVELRHQATHEELPSLPKLRTATQKALRWIWDYYWTTLDSNVSQNKPEDCLGFMKRFVEEKNDQVRQGMESKLEEWDAELIIDALVQIQSVSEDPAVLLRCIQLQGQFMNREADLGSFQSDTNLEPTTVSLEDAKAELFRMENMLNDTDEPLLQKSKPIDEIDEVISTGWTMWEGAWQPKPIGVV